MSGGHGAQDHGPENKRVALLISVLALLLAVSEILGQKAQTQTLQSNIEASNLWSFFQAKTIRKTVSEAAADELETLVLLTKEPEVQKVFKARIDRFRATALRMETEPETGEGRKELREKALAAQKERDKSGKKHYRFELATGAIQIAIVLASASIITSAIALLWGGCAMGCLGLLFLIGGFLV